MLYVQVTDVLLAGRYVNLCQCIVYKCIIRYSSGISNENCTFWPQLAAVSIAEDVVLGHRATVADLCVADGSWSDQPKVLLTCCVQRSSGSRILPP